ncbi:cell envelope integrity protein TolA [Candidatus Anaplasma sp. TIGMIC]|nr:cell envelope integrity protein TolA [Candidatus Anaplasma sp. TIGMIC]
MFGAGWSIRSTLRNNVHVVSSLLVHAVMCVFLVVHTSPVRSSGTGLNCPDGCPSGRGGPADCRNADLTKESGDALSEDTNVRLGQASGLMPPGISSYNPARMSLARSHSDSLHDGLEQADVVAHAERTEGTEIGGPRPNRRKARHSARVVGTREKDTGISGKVMNAVVSHFASCWTLPSVMSHAEDSVVKINVALGPDGTVIKANVADELLYGQNPFFRAVADSALRAVHRCSPVSDLVNTDFSLWNEMVVTFEPY